MLICISHRILMPDWQHETVPTLSLPSILYSLHKGMINFLFIFLLDYPWNGASIHRPRTIAPIASAPIYGSLIVHLSTNNCSIRWVYFKFSILSWKCTKYYRAYVFFSVRSCTRYFHNTRITDQLKLGFSTVFGYSSGMKSTFSEWQTASFIFIFF